MTEPLLPLIPSEPRGTRSWPLHEVGRRVTYHLLSWLLTHRHPTDAFTSAYSVPSVERRLSGKAIERLTDGVPMVIYLWDFDCHAAHLATGGSGEAQADDAWWERTLRLVAAMLRAHPGGFVYRTRGGARIVYRRAEPLVLRAAGDELVWRREYCQCLAYLARRFGIVCDPQTHDWPRLMRLPRATRDGVTLDLEMVGNSRDVGIFFYSPDEAEQEINLEAVRDLSKRDRRWEPIARTLAGNDSARAPRSPRRAAAVENVDVDPGVLALLASDLGTAMRGMVGNHAAHLALAGACYARGIPFESGPDLGRSIALAAGDPNERAHVWHTTAERVKAGDAVVGAGALVQNYPHLASILDAALPDAGGARGLREALDARGSDPGVPAAEAVESIRQAIDRRNPGPSLVRVTEGAGKTRVALRVLRERAEAIPIGAARVASADKVLYVAPTHAVAEEVAAGLRGQRAEYWRSPLAVRDAAGAPVCTQYGKVEAMAAAGHSVTAWCESPCPDLDGCKAREQAIQSLGPSAPPVVVVTVHALLEQGLSWAGDDALVVVDEDPEALATVELTRVEIEAAAGAMEVFSAGEQFRGPVLRALAAGMERGEIVTGEALPEILRRGCEALIGDTAWDAEVANFGWSNELAMLDDYAMRAGWREKHEDSGTVWVKRAGWAPWCPPDVRARVFQGHADPRLTQASKVHAALGHLACGIVRKAPEGKVCRERAVSTVEVSHVDPSRRVIRGVMASPAIGDSLRRHGPTVLLDATGNPEVLSALAGATVPTTTIRVADGSPVERAVLYWSAATRRSVFAGDTVRWENGLSRYLGEALRRAVAFKPGGTVALFAWKALASVLARGDDPVAQQFLAIVTDAGGRVVLGWYGNARGRNDWRGCDALVSVGDPRPNLGSARAIAAVLGMRNDADRLYDHATAAELSQVSGRLRAPWRSTPALHLHVGTVAPIGWDARSDVLELPRGLPDELDPRAVQQAVHVYGSQRLAAVSLGVRRETVSRTLAGDRKAIPFAQSPCVTSNTIIDLYGLDVTHGDTAKSHDKDRVSLIRRASPFDDTAQFELLARCGGAKAAADILGVSKATAYHWATARGTRRMPQEARQRLEMYLAAQDAVDDAPTPADRLHVAAWVPGEGLAV